MLKKQFMKRLREEYDAMRSWMIGGNVSAEDIWNSAYEITVKGHLVQLYANEQDDRYYNFSNDMVRWLLEKENVLDYLYIIWKNSDCFASRDVIDGKDGNNE